MNKIKYFESPYTYGVSDFWGFWHVTNLVILPSYLHHFVISESTCLQYNQKIIWKWIDPWLILNTLNSLWILSLRLNTLTITSSMKPPPNPNQLSLYNYTCTLNSSSLPWIPWHFHMQKTSTPRSFAWLYSLNPLHLHHITYIQVLLFMLCLLISSSLKEPHT
jgi:hypothetical protein